MNLTFGELAKVNLARCEDVFHALDEWSPTDWGCAFAGEAGEACNKIKKLRRLDGADAEKDTFMEREKLKHEIGEEIADAVIYADLLAQRIGLDLGQLVLLKFNKVSQERGSNHVL